ncbi:MAG: hypothetical protein FWC16_06110 [Defluviitaleaceae bacterium]|nr:hypothetical protein [Defluviitaleaceae bacterium]MCL2274483.1 hypothetical protein [Defluviitaleaceae bacterium]
MKRFFLLCGVLLIALVMVNAIGFLVHRTTFIDGERVRIREIQRDGVTIRFRGFLGIDGNLRVSPPLFLYEGGGAGMVADRSVPGRRTYTLWHFLASSDGEPLTDATWVSLYGASRQWTSERGGTPVPHPEGAVTWQEQALFEWALAGYAENRTFVWYFHNIVLGAAFLLLGAALMIFPETFQRWGANFNVNGDYTEPKSINKMWFQVVGGVVIVLVFILHFIFL